MGAKYTSNQTFSGYNSSPPADDGSQVAANLITWAKHKTKLADPIKTETTNIDNDLVAAFDYTPRRITTSDTVVAGDHMRTVEIAPTATTSVVVTLPDAATLGTLFRTYIKNSSPHSQTIARATVGDTIDGSASDLDIPSGAGLILSTNNNASSVADGYLITGEYSPQHGPGVIAASRNLVGLRASVSTIDIDCDEILLKNSAGDPYLATSVNLTANIGTSGANGLDTGSENGSTWYYGWVIAMADGTVASLLSESSSAPTLPSGYTFKALATVVRNNSSSDFIGYRQVGNEYWYHARQQVLNNATATAETAVTVSTVVPPIALDATFISFPEIQTDGSGEINANVNFGYISGSVFFTHGTRLSGLATGTAVSLDGDVQFRMPIVGQQFYYDWDISIGSGQGLDVYVQGFKLPVGE